MQFSRLLVLLWPPFLAAADSTTYIGDAYSYHIAALALDATGNTFLTGSRTTVAPQSTPARPDVFVSKLDPAGNVTIVATVSGAVSQQANGIALDSAGNIYIVGSTTSPDFPLHNPLQSTLNISTDGTGFLMKFSPTGTILYSTLLGGTFSASVLNAVAADAKGNAYVGGESSASDYPHTTGMPAGQTGGNLLSTAFFAKISSAGDQILYAGGLSATTHACNAGSSCFLSKIGNAITSIALDPSGNTYLAGNTTGLGLPTTPGVLNSTGIGPFVAKVNAAGTGLAYVTLFDNVGPAPGGAVVFPDIRSHVYAIAVDAAGNAYVAGSTRDANFPVTPSALQPALATPIGGGSAASSTDAFVAKLNPTGTAMVWATFLGGTDFDEARNLTLNPAGNVWVSGTTMSLDFPVSEGVQAFSFGREFLAEINPSGSSLMYAALYPVNTTGTAIAADSAGVIHLAGGTGLVSTRTSAQTGAPHLFGLTNVAAGGLTGRIAPGEVISIYGLHLGPPAPVFAAFDDNGFLPTSLGGIQVTINNIAAPLIYVSDQQINAIVPLEAAVPSAALRVSFNGAAQPDFRAAVDQAIPEVFYNGGQQAAAINQDGTFNSHLNPAKVGTVVWIWTTGLGNIGGLQDGQMATGAQDFHICCVHDVANNTDLTPVYAGAAPGMAAGLVQINFQVTNSANYYLNVSNTQSEQFSVWVSY